jgi:sugar phosphate isomerase/epimerase
MHFMNFNGYYTGFADEAGGDIDTQIRATLELGWTNIESRNIDGKNIHDIADEAFDAVCEKLDRAGVRINCFGSAIANWQKQITDPFDITLSEIDRAIPRMQRLGTRLVRIMSYAVLPDRAPDDQMEAERFERLREIVPRFLDAGIQPVHENCMNYGGMGWPYTLRILENVPGLKLVFDTGNPVFTDDRSKPKPYPKQSAWEFYRNVKDHIAYIHIKDGVYDSAQSAMQYTHAGEGNGDVRRIVADLLASDYSGGISMEPHLSVVFHADGPQNESAVRYENYVEYGRRFMRLVDNA